MLSKPAIVVRAATEADVASIQPWLADPENSLWRANDLLSAIDASAYRLQVASLPIDKQHAAPQAFALLRGVLDEWSLLYLLVAPDARRRGLAQALLRSLQERIGAEGGSILLEVRQGNMAARGLYQSCGFVEQGLRPNYYESLQADGEREDALLLGWPASITEHV